MKFPFFIIILFLFSKSFAQNKVLPIDETNVIQVLDKQKAPYKLLLFWVPKCETIEKQYNDTETLQKNFKNLVILPVAVVSTLKYENDFHNLYYRKNGLGNSLEVDRKLENPYDNFDTFKGRFLEKIGGNNKDAFYFLFDKDNKLVKDWENLPKKEELAILLK